LKANMTRLYNYISEEHFNKSSGERPQLYRPLLFTLCYFHSVLLERRKFGTLGYNVIYDFNYSDFEVSENIIALYIHQMPDSSPESVPFTTLRYLISDASYGGRVTDDWDRRMLNTYIEQFMCPQAITMEGFRLSSAPDYFIPPDAPPYQTFKDFCAHLPLDDPPEAFGQHPNADIASQIANAFSLLDNLMSVNATLVRGGGGGGQSAAVNLEERCLNTLANLEEQVPKPIDYDSIAEAIDEEAGSALNTCLLQEIQRYNVLLRKIHRQREELRRAVKGEIVMNDELDSIFQALLVGKLPPPWQSAYPSSKGLASWTRDLAERVDQMVQWGRSPLKVFWLAGFTYPTGFLKALQQQQARTDDKTVDQYVWEFFVLSSEDKTIMHGAKEGAYMRGIFVEGAGWDSNTGALCEPAPMRLIEAMPIIHFKPRLREGKPKLKNSYACPLYMYPVRTGTRERPSYVVTVDLPSGASEPEHWVKRGTALLLSTTD
jgi:dynein heavy chain